MHRVWFTCTQCYILQRTGFGSKSHYVSIHCYIANCTVSDSRSESRIFCYWYKTSRDGFEMVVSSVKRVKYRVVWALKVVRVLRWWWWCGSRPLQQPTGPWPPHLLGRALLLCCRAESSKYQHCCWFTSILFHFHQIWTPFYNWLTTDQAPPENFKSHLDFIPTRLGRNFWSFWIVECWSSLYKCVMPLTSENWWQFLKCVIKVWWSKSSFALTASLWIGFILFTCSVLTSMQCSCDWSVYCVLCGCAVCTYCAHVCMCIYVHGCTMHMWMCACVCAWVVNKCELVADGCCPFPTPPFINSLWQGTKTAGDALLSTSSSFLMFNNY